MTRAWLALATLLAAPLALSADLRIDLVGCQPSGAVASLAERWDGKDFWAREHVTLQMALERKWEFEDAIDSCKISHATEPAEREACIAYVRGRYSSMIRCLQHAKRMCRHHGGCGASP